MKVLHLVEKNADDLVTAINTEVAGYVGRVVAIYPVRDSIHAWIEVEEGEDKS